MKVLLSIKPEFVEKIFSGEKRFEYRKSIFRRSGVTTVMVYSTMPVGKIVGEFTIKTIQQGTPSMIWRKTHRFSGISHDFFYSYFKNVDVAYAIEINSVKEYKKLKDPKEIFENFCAPQSFMYIK